MFTSSGKGKMIYLSAFQNACSQIFRIHIMFLCRVTHHQLKDGILRCEIGNPVGTFD